MHRLSEHVSEYVFFLEKTILSAKRSKIAFTDEEKLVFLRAYQAHPCSWLEIIETIRENLLSMTSISARAFYATSDNRTIKLRLSTKLSKMLAAPDKESTDVR